MPLAPELRPILLALFDAAEPGEEAVLPMLKVGRENPRTQFLRIVAKAGAAPWPRPFHNLRASCAAD